MSIPPIPKSAAVARQWEHTRARRRMMEGEWKGDLRAHIQKEAGFIRADGWGEPETSSNVLLSVSGQLATLYASAPLVTHEETSGKEVLGAIEDGGLWGLMPRVQRDCLGLREYFIRVDIEADGSLTFRPVPPDLVDAEGDRSDCDRLLVYREARERTSPADGKTAWVWDVFDISGKEPSFKVMSADLNTDVSETYGLSGIVGDKYLARWKDPETGGAIIPAIVYHAEITGALYDAYAWSELYAGTLTVGCLWTYFNHCVLDASHPQRWAVGVGVPSNADDDSPRQSVIADPATVLLLTPLDDTKQPMVGQWAAGCDVGVLSTAIQAVERKVASFAGISESDFARMSGDPRSGYALSISRDSARRAARRFEPAFSRSDKRMLALCGALLSAHHKATYPSRGYALEYPGPPKTRAEVLAEIQQLYDLGLATKAMAYQLLHPDVSAEEAQRITDAVKVEQGIHPEQAA